MPNLHHPSAFSARRILVEGPWLLVAALFAGCTSTQPTEIVAGVSTQIRVPEHLQTVAVIVQVGGEVRFCETYAVADGQVALPATLGVLGDSGLGQRGEVTVQVVGMRRSAEDSDFGRNCVINSPEREPLDVSVIRSRRLTFVDDVIKFLPMPLKESCSDTLCPSDADGNPQTCVGGKCVSAQLDARTLPDYDESLLFGNRSTCFDPSACLPPGATVPVLLEDRESCTFRALWPDSAPRPAAGELNVRLFYRSFGSEILDVDFDAMPVEQREGFAFQTEDEPLVFKLADNLCESNYLANKVLSIEASALCPAKRALQPICDGYEPPDPRAESTPNDGSGSAGGEGDDMGMGGADDSGPRSCTLAGLEPVESAIYVLMDRSQSMSKFFGDGGLQFAVDLPLASPVAARTKVGFGLLPAEAAQCGTTDYAVPQVPFGDVDAARAPISELLGNTSNVLSSDPAQFFLEAALLGAYQGVASVQTDEDERFNRRAVVVISNRDLSAGPCPGQTALELAASQQALGDDRIFTYAVALDDGEVGALQSADALAEAGGTNVFNGVTDEAEGARAINDILTELGTCLYKVGTRLDAGDPASLPDVANMSYLDPATSAAVDIPYNPDCTEDADESESGWAREDGLVRLCGQACADLRQVVGDAGALAASQGQPAPTVPLVVTAPCTAFVYPPDE